MSKELAKAYEPHEVEDQNLSISGWTNGYFHAERRSGEKALYHRHPAAQHYRPASYGSCAGRNPAGYSDPLAAECRATLPCGSRAPTTPPLQQRQRSWRLCARRDLPKRTWGGKASWSALGRGKRNTAARIVDAAEKAGFFLRLGRESALPWTRAAPRRYEKCLYSLYEKGLIYRGERIINWCPHCKTSISDAEVEYAGAGRQFLASALSAQGRQRLSWSWPPPVRKPCWAIRLWQCIPMMSATRTLIGKTRDPAAGWP